MSMKQITDSEWDIMRILWEESPFSSGEITFKLKELKEWSPTTVKTFLSRLVGKKILGFKTIGRRHMYFPLVTEKDCVEYEMSLIIKRVYGGSLVFESEHFQFRGDNNLDYATDVSDCLEKKYERITTDLGINLTTKKSVYLYKTQSRLHSALGYINAPSWVRAGGSWGIIHLSPKETFHDEDAGCVAVHVFTEILLYNLDSEIPVWITRGVSAYYGGWLSDKRISKTLQSNELTSDFLEHKFNNSDFIKFNENNGFIYSLTVIKYIIHRYGMKTLKQFTRNYYDYLKVFGVSKEQFFTDWRAFLKETYIKREELI